MFQGCFRSVSRVFQGNWKEFQKSFKEISTEFQASFKGVTRGFQGSFNFLNFKEVSKVLLDWQFVSKPSLQCARAASKANLVLGQLARAVTCRDSTTFIRLYQVYVRPHLEYTVQSWCPWTKADMEVLERVQHRAVMMVSNLQGRSYKRGWRSWAWSLLKPGGEEGIWFKL